MDMQDTAMLTPVIVGLLQAIKYALPTSAKKFIPLIGVAVGVVVAYFLWEATSLKENVLLWVMLGLSSVGLYQSGKAFYPSSSTSYEPINSELTSEIGEVNPN